jgi:uncharacterized membrane protein YcaP (DUF421 family)
VVPQDLNISPEYEGLPVTMIIDGQIIQENLTKMNIKVDWLKNELVKSGIHNIKQIIFAALDTHGKLYYQLKSSTGKDIKGV